MLYRTEVIGRLGKDAVTSIVDGGSTVINFSLCYSKKYKHKDGTPDELKIWMECSIWKKQGESTEIAAALTKGRQIWCEGQMTADIFIDKKDQPQPVLKLRISNIDLL